MIARSSAISALVSTFSRPTIEVLACLAKSPSQIEHVGDATGHAGGEVAAGGAEHDDATAGHVFATVVADALDDGGDAGVADTEALASAAVDVDLTGRGAVQRDVADDDVVLGLEGRRSAGG